MATNQLSIFDLANADQQAIANRASCLIRTGRGPSQPLLLNDLDDGEWDYNSLVSLIVTDVNGTMKLPNQDVVVEYLKDNQKLVIPVALGMEYEGQGWCPQQTTLMARYNRLKYQSYLDLKKLVMENKTRVALAAAIDALPTPSQQTIGRMNDWNLDFWCTLENGELEASDMISITFGAISRAIQSNCDIRDFFKLNDPDMVVDDSAWKSLNGLTKERLDIKLKPYTLQNIAALNYFPCANDTYSAWTRSYGIAAGVLHSKNSKSQNELRFEARIPKKEELDPIQALETQTELRIYPMALNILAMFGLMHLNKDHTYKTADTAMARINTSYIKTLRTAVPYFAIEYMLGHMESICRTAAHPFGLAQTYWLARVMHAMDALATPLGIRIGVCPPPVQRALQIEAASREWMSISAGMSLSTHFKAPLDTISQEITTIRAAPPAYSGLYALYGIEQKKVLSDRATIAISAMMPCVYGYAKSQHETQAGVVDGLALALSLNNVARDSKSLTSLWKGLWDGYVASTSEMGLVEYATGAMVKYEEAIAGETSTSQQ